VLAGRCWRGRVDAQGGDVLCLPLPPDVEVRPLCAPTMSRERTTLSEIKANVRQRHAAAPFRMRGEVRVRVCEEGLIE
jgi:hypothetical protein